jgi:serralysin
MGSRRSLASCMAVATWAFLVPVSASAFILDPSAHDPWLTTASGPRSGNGDPATLTWSILPDGTSLRGNSIFSMESSNLISFMNTNFGGNPGQTDLTQQPWFDLFEDSFARWEELGGVDYVYEPYDDGAFHPTSAGVRGVRGDIRIGGFDIDGSSGTLAFTWLPTAGSDMAFDTSETTFFTDASNNYINFRNTLMHEIGHSFGVLHVNSTSSLLMEPIINTSFDGPQLDEVRAVQFYFGDANEKVGNGLGNDTAALATSLGAIMDGVTKTVGADANVPGQAISPTAPDFVSISNLDDFDYYSFIVSQPSLLAATLTPRGGVFTQASDGQTPTSFNANARSDLALSVLATDGASVLATASANIAGVAESLADVLLPGAGAYYARIAGADDTIQLYELSLSIVALLPGDYNADGTVDAGDYIVWRKNPANYGGDPAGYNTWRANFGRTAGGASLSNATVPEPVSALLLILGAAFGICRWR